MTSEALINRVQRRGLSDSERALQNVPRRVLRRCAVVSFKGSMGSQKGSQKGFSEGGVSKKCLECPVGEHDLLVVCTS